MRDQGEIWWWWWANGLEATVSGTHSYIPYIFCYDGGWCWIIICIKSSLIDSSQSVDKQHVMVCVCARVVFGSIVETERHIYSCYLLCQAEATNQRKLAHRGKIGRIHFSYCAPCFLVPWNFRAAHSIYIDRHRQHRHRWPLSPVRQLTSIMSAGMWSTPSLLPFTFQGLLFMSGRVFASLIRCACIAARCCSCKTRGMNTFHWW